MQVWKIEVQKGKICKGGKYKYTEKSSTSEQAQFCSTYRDVTRLGFGGGGKPPKGRRSPLKLER